MQRFKSRSRLASLFLFLFAYHSAQALQINCKSFDSFQHPDFDDPNMHLLVGSANSFNCRTSHGLPIDVDIYGVGPGIRADMGDLVTINCPLISEKKVVRKLDEHPTFMLFGADASAAALFGARLGFFMNARGGICALTGVSAAIGASIQVSSLILSKHEHYQTQQQQGKRVPGDRNISLENIFTW